VYPLSLRAASMFYSIQLTTAAGAILFELGVRQLAARILYEDVAHRDAVRTLRHREPHLLKNRNNKKVDLKI
jgi:hypothetical protein